MLNLNLCRSARLQVLMAPKALPAHKAQQVHVLCQIVAMWNFLVSTCSRHESANVFIKI